MKKSVIKIENDEQWHELRSKVIGSSDVAALFGLSSFKSKYTLWHEKAGNIKHNANNTRIKAGKHLEAGIASLAAEKLDIKIKKNEHFYIHGNIGATPDYHYDDGILEIKNMDYLQFRHKCPEDAPPHEYVLQLQHQLHCINKASPDTAASGGTLAIFVGGNDLKIFNFDYRPSIGEKIEVKASDFFQSIKYNNSPDINNPADFKVIKDIYKYGDNIKDLTDHDQATAFARSYLEAKKTMKAAKERMDMAGAELIRLLDSGYAGAALRNGLSLSLTKVKENSGKEITQDMVGMKIGYKKSYIKLNVKDNNNE